MKRALLITLEFPPANGGVQRYLYEICGHLPKSQITVVTPFGEAYIGNNINTLQVKFYSRFFWPRWLPLVNTLRRMYALGRFDTLLVGEVLPLGMVAKILYAFWGVPYAVFTYGMDITLPRLSFRKTALLKRILATADKIFTISSYTKDKIMELNVPDSKIDFIHPVVELKSLPRINQGNIDAVKNRYIPQGKPVILTVARLVPRKGHAVVVHAMKQVLKRFPNAVYVIVGDGPEQENIKKIAANEGVSSSVVMTGEVDDLTLHCLYESCDVFALTPTNDVDEHDIEGFGIVYLEAQAHRKPVIASRSGGADEGAGGTGCATIVEQNNSGALAQAITNLLADPDESRALGERGFIRVSTMTWKNEIAPLVNLLAE